MSTQGNPEHTARRVLIVHYHFLPVHNVAIKQLLSYARRLAQYGWQPTVLTRDWKSMEDQDASWGLSWEPELESGCGFPIHRVAAPAPLRPWAVPKKAWPLRQVIKIARVLFGNYPDGFVRWVSPAVEAARALAKDTPFDVVMTYCPPETNHIVGQRLAHELGIPWVPFFGDLWEFFIAALPRTPEGMIRRAYHRRWLAPATACAAVSPYMAAYLERTYKKRSEVILAGFDPAELASAPRTPHERGRRLVVSHVGSLYPLDQRPEIFFSGLDELLRRHPEVESTLEVRFVGSKCDAYLRDLVRGRPSERVCSIMAKVDSTTAVSLVHASDALLAFNCSFHRDRHGTMSYPTKIFEAFGARRPVLAMPPDGDWVDILLARTGAGKSAATAADVSAALWSWHTDWQRSGSVPYEGRSDALDELTVDRQVERLAALLDSVATPPLPPRLGTSRYATTD